MTERFENTESCILEIDKMTCNVVGSSITLAKKNGCMVIAICSSESNK